MKKYLKVILYFVVLQVIHESCICQITPDPLEYNPIAKCIAQVKLVDSEYLLIPQLIITSKTENAKIHKRIWYDQGDFCGYNRSDGRFYLRKELFTTTFNIIMDGVRHHTPDSDFEEFREFGWADHLTDTIFLKDYYPLEIGKYQILIEFDYFYKGKKYTVESDWFSFDVPYQPKKAIFF